MIKIEAVDVTPNEAMFLAHYFLKVAGKDYLSINDAPVATISNLEVKADEIIDEVQGDAISNLEVKGNELVGNITIPKSTQDDEPTSKTLVTHDKKGMPWDERIHSSSKAFNADGSWRIRRNVDPAFVTQIENELRGTVTITPPITIIPPPPPAAVEPDPTLAFVSFVNKITAAQAAKTLHIADVNVQVLKVGLKSLPELATRTELIPDIEKALGI